MGIKDEKEMVIQRRGYYRISCNGDFADDIASSGQYDDYNYTATPPTVTTNAATYTQMSSTGNPEITFNGNLTIGSYKSVSVYFEYGLTTAYPYTSAKITKKTSGTFSATAITNLAVGTTYDYRADVKYGSTIIHGSNQTAVVSDGSGGGSGGGSTVIYTGITVEPLRYHDHQQ